MKKGLLYILVLWLAVGCRLDGMNDREPSSTIAMPISISLPTDEMQSMRPSMVRRAIGDPGAAEQFAFPSHIYVFVLKDNGDGSWSVWHKEHMEPAVEEWIPKRYNGRLQTAGDSIYEYDKHLNLMLSNEKFEGQVLAIASEHELVFNTPFASIATAEQVRNLRFSTADPSTKASLQHIYSTPYNYEWNGEYYGSFSSIYQKVPHIDLMLYHVAAKVDIKWSVDEDKRINKADPYDAVRLTNMKACNLFDGYAYCFKPMENVVATQPLTSGATIEIVRPADEGLWWEGRAYFYTIPYTVGATPGDYFPLQMEMSTNGSDAKYRPTLNLRIDTDSPFVPWLRAMFNISAPLEDKTETKNIDS